QLQHLKQRFAAMPALQVLELAGLSAGQADELLAMLLARPSLMTKVASDGRVEWVGPETPRISLPNWRNHHQPNRELPPGLSAERGLLRLPEEPQAADGGIRGRSGSGGSAATAAAPGTPGRPLPPPPHTALQSRLAAAAAAATGLRNRGVVTGVVLQRTARAGGDVGGRAVPSPAGKLPIKDPNHQIYIHHNHRRYQEQQLRYTSDGR
ncbi:hypothetical protein VaNZ11_013049, partial [Volvox africanus]